MYNIKSLKKQKEGIIYMQFQAPRGEERKWKKLYQDCSKIDEIIS